MKIYLASQSPRRKELLKLMGVEFETLSVDVPEELLLNENADHYSMRVTREKFLAGWQKILHEKLAAMPVLSADTEVVLNSKTLGKPKDYQDAFMTLKKYSGRCHEVLTSVGIKYYSFEKIILNKTLVYFSKMTDEDIHQYLATDNYQDKAGSYGIQSSIGQFIERIEGCFYSVMGLPLSDVRKLLKDLQHFQKRRGGELL